MPKLNEYISIGICSGYGDGDFRVSCGAANLSIKQIEEIRKTIPVAIAVLERYFQEAIEKESSMADGNGRGAT